MSGDQGIPGTGQPRFRPAQIEKRAPCQAGCAAGGDPRRWIGTIAQRHKLGLAKEEAYAAAWSILTDVNPFPSVLGRICPHPCETDCNRSDKDGAVAINALERFLGDWAIDRGLALAQLESDRQPESVGVVGAGPSGLSFAYQMARRGYDVTVYERKPAAGGMLRYGVPDYRLPPTVLDAEIARIEALGVDIRLNTGVGDDVPLNELRSTHEILYLGIGAQKGRLLGIPGENGGGVLMGTEYLGRVNQGERIDLGENVAVIGGGNTAIDAARTARRTGADVTIFYRRTRNEMPAIALEVDEALEEGVALELLVAPQEVRRLNGDVAALLLQRMELGAPDDSGRRRPVPIDGSEFEVSASAVIAAVSQEPDWSDGFGPGGRWLDASDAGFVAERLWAGGDVLGLDIAGRAIAHGRRAAESVHAQLRGLEPPAADVRDPIDATRVNLGYLDGMMRSTPARLPVEVALASPEAEVSLGIIEEQLLHEANRCLSCGSCFGCQHCFMYCTPACFTAVEEPRPGVYFTMSLDACEECGKCVEVCPCGYLEVV